MLPTTNPYKTLKTIDGIEYISVSEHEEIVKALINLQDSLTTLNKSTGDLVSTVEKLRSQVNK